MMRVKEPDLAKQLARFDSLTAEAQNLLGDCEGTNGAITDPVGFSEWRTKAATLMTLVVPQGHVHRLAAEGLSELPSSAAKIQSAIGLMRGVKDDLLKGMLDPLRAQIEAEFAADFMRQASDLLKGEGEHGLSCYLPAAVLAGVILERGLRKLCADQEPVIRTKKNGKFVMMRDLVAELKAAKVISPPKAKQLEAWVALRNHAAHGDLENVDQADVQAMIEGIGKFLNPE